MAGRQVLIDGYNVIGADPVLSRLRDQSLEAAREALVNCVSASPRFLGDAVTLVFDGRGVGSSAPNRRMGHVTVSFSSSAQSADDFIVAKARASRDPGQLVVVTNDGAIRDACRGFGCVVTGSENLLEQMSAPRIRRRFRSTEATEESAPPTLSTSKKGNPKRLPKRSRQGKQEYRF